MELAGLEPATSVVRELTKPTAEKSIEDAGPRRVLPGDLLVTLDGYSLGKAAVFKDNYRAVPDSHVGIMRLTNRRHGLALSCFLNSSLGQAQMELSTSGSMAQQLSKFDLERVRVPRQVIERASEIGAAYAKRLSTYESTPSQVRRLICEMGADVSEALLQSTALDENARILLGELGGASGLRSLLGLLRPEMF